MTDSRGSLAAVGESSRRLTRELVQIAAGQAPLRPDPKDWRFQDAAWAAHPLYRRWGQSYLAACEYADNLLDGLARPSSTARFLLNVVESAAAPTNTLLGNPAALKRAFETGGRSLVRGLRHIAEDIRANGGMPSTYQRGVYEVGRDLAITPGAVIDRDDCAEVLQYAPSTSTVHVRPVLIVPPPIGRYYFLDLRPGRSFVEYALSHGLQTFLLSWRNPTAAEADWGTDTYAQRILTAIDAVREVTGAPDVDVIGFCAGGILTTLALSHLAALGDSRVHTASFAVTLLDFGSDMPIQAFSAPKLLSLARWNSARAGVIGARDMGAVFTWMRPNELVWNYWVNNYLMGNQPEPFDILAWNADGTNLPARLHAQFLDIFEHNLLPAPGATSALGTPVDLSRITVPTFVTGGMSDHLTPWTGCYRTTQLLGGPSTFVLSNSGHIQSLVNPPNNSKASYFTGPPAATAEQWFSGADQHTGSWWTAWADWIVARSAGTADAPQELGSAEHPAREPAPGSYVRDLIPSTG
jgi:polyhydroxyalkanoate synthase subunit PhaC